MRLSALPVTRLRMALDDEGWRMSTEAPAPMEKLFQFTTARSEPWVMVIDWAPGVAMLTSPAATLAPVGS